MKTRPRSEAATQKRETVLFAVTGMSPAVLTETVWALAHENPPAIPDRVVVVTTRAGRAAIQHELFDNKVWDGLRAALQKKRRSLQGRLRFGTTGDDILVFTRSGKAGRSVELEDIRTPADNEAVADFLLEKLRPFTENPDVRLVCSLAGGRKTMGALLYACLSLIGRETDRLTHVLVNEPFDDPRLQPKFYFPTSPPTVHQKSEVRGQRSEVSSASARIELADVPFVPLRQLFPREIGRLPGSFSNLVRQYRRLVEELGEPPQLQFDEDLKIVRVNGIPVEMPATAIALLDFLAQRCRAAQPSFRAYKDAIEPFKEFLAKWGEGHDVMNYRSDDSIKNLHKNLQGDLAEQNIRKLVHAIKTSLRQAGIPLPVAAHLIPRRGHCGIRVSK